MAIASAISIFDCPNRLTKRNFVGSFYAILNQKKILFQMVALSCAVAHVQCRAIFLTVGAILDYVECARPFWAVSTSVLAVLSHFGLC